MDIFNDQYHGNFPRSQISPTNKIIEYEEYSKIMSVLKFMKHSVLKVITQIDRVHVTRDITSTGSWNYSPK